MERYRLIKANVDQGRISAEFNASPLHTDDPRYAVKQFKTREECETMRLEGVQKGATTIQKLNAIVAAEAIAAIDIKAAELAAAPQPVA